jgi:hypothetical protein
MLPPVFDKANVMEQDFIEGLRQNLGGRHCPDDQTFIRHLTTEQLYSSGEKTTRLRLILERLEQSFGHREPADLAAATIEHVLPQTITDEWEEELGTGAREQWDLLLHSLGNLTLTGYNAELSSQPYAMKRVSLGNSHFELNRYFARIERWSADAIRERATTLAARALRIWPDVGRNPSLRTTKKAATQRPGAVRFRGITHQVSSWKDGFIKLLELFESDQPGLLNRIAAERSMPSIISLDKDQFKALTVQFGDVHISTYASAATLQGWCRRVASLGDIGESDYEFTSPDAVRFGGVTHEVSTWKEGFVKLLELFESSQPGLLSRIAAERSMPSIVSLDEDQFKAFKVQIGDVFINTHAGSSALHDWCRRVASLANISESDYAFVMPDSVGPN